MSQWQAGAGVVEFPDGRTVRGRALRAPMQPGEIPEFGVYLLRRESAPMHWPSVWIKWPDLACPSDRKHALVVLADAFERARNERVEVACTGGRGRTGTAMAAISVMAGIPPTEAVAWVRSHYLPKAVEMPWQRRWISSLDPQQFTS
jgi:protein-tyrosine phosphatase